MSTRYSSEVAVLDQFGQNTVFVWWLLSDCEMGRISLCFVDVLCSHGTGEKMQMGTSKYNSKKYQTWANQRRKFKKFHRTDKNSLDFRGQNGNSKQKQKFDQKPANANISILWIIWVISFYYIFLIFLFMMRFYPKWTSIARKIPSVGNRPWNWLFWEEFYIFIAKMQTEKFPKVQKFQKNTPINREINFSYKFSQIMKIIFQMNEKLQKWLKRALYFCPAPMWQISRVWRVFLTLNIRLLTTEFFFDTHLGGLSIY